MDKNNNIYGLIGYPLGHSFSQSFFNDKFQSEGIDAEYRNFEIENIEDFPQIINGDIKGLNVTIPYKEQIIPFLNHIDKTAEAIGAVNVIKIDRHADTLILTGYNSDVIGFTDSLKPLLKPYHKKALILGTGGASKAVNYALQQLGIETSFVSPSNGKSDYSYKGLNEEVFQKHQIIINASPVGMYPHVNECPDIPYDFINETHICYDLIYNPEETLFLQKARMNNATTKNGMEMLVLQALAAWNIWNQ